MIGKDMKAGYVLDTACKTAENVIIEQFLYVCIFKGQCSSPLSPSLLPSGPSFPLPFQFATTVCQTFFLLSAVEKLWVILGRRTYQIYSRGVRERKEQEEASIQGQLQ